MESKTNTSSVKATQFRMPTFLRSEFEKLGVEVVSENVVKVPPRWKVVVGAVKSDTVPTWQYFILNESKKVVFDLFATSFLSDNPDDATSSIERVPTIPIDTAGLLPIFGIVVLGTNLIRLRKNWRLVRQSTMSWIYDDKDKEVVFINADEYFVRMDGNRFPMELMSPSSTSASAHGRFAFLKAKLNRDGRLDDPELKELMAFMSAEMDRQSGHNESTAVRAVAHEFPKITVEYHVSSAALKELGQWDPKKGWPSEKSESTVLWNLHLTKNAIACFEAHNHSGHVVFEL